jgi:NADPH2:quinone reductase
MTSNSVPKVMKAVQMLRTGGPDVLQYKTDFPVPVPGHGEVLVKNEFIGINFVDVLVFPKISFFFATSNMES